MTRYQPPCIDSPNPYPSYANPRNGEPFTPSELVDVHFELSEAMLAIAHVIVMHQTGAEIPDFEAVQRAAEQFASVCLFDALNVAQANTENPTFEDEL